MLKVDGFDFSHRGNSFYESSLLNKLRGCMQEEVYVILKAQYTPLLVY